MGHRDSLSLYYSYAPFCSYSVSSCCFLFVLGLCVFFQQSWHIPCFFFELLNDPLIQWICSTFTLSFTLFCHKIGPVDCRRPINGQQITALVTDMWCETGTCHSPSWLNCRCCLHCHHHNHFCPNSPQMGAVMQTNTNKQTNKYGNEYIKSWHRLPSLQYRMEIWPLLALQSTG